MPPQKGTQPPHDNPGIPASPQHSSRQEMPSAKRLLTLAMSKKKRAKIPQKGKADEGGECGVK